MFAFLPVPSSLPVVLLALGATILCHAAPFALFELPIRALLLQTIFGRAVGCGFRGVLRLALRESVCGGFQAPFFCFG